MQNKTEQTYDEKLGIIQDFSSHVLVPLKEAQARLQARIKSIQPDNPEALQEDTSDLTLEQEKAEVLDKLRKAKTLAEEHAHLAPIFYASLKTLTNNGDALITPSHFSSGSTYTKSVRNTLKNMQTKATEAPPIVSAVAVTAKPEEAMKRFLEQQEVFIAKIRELQLYLTAFSHPVDDQTPPKEQETQAVIEDYLETCKATIEAHETLGFTSLLKDKDKPETERMNAFVEACTKNEFEQYNAHQQRLSALQSKIKPLPLAKQVHECAKEPPKNLRSTPRLLAAARTQEPRLNAVLEPVQERARQTYLQTRTIRHFQQWPLHSKDARKMDRKTAVLRSLLLLNFHNPTVALKPDGKTPKDEVTDLPTYLQTVLLEAYPETFTLAEDGRLAAIPTVEHSSLITEALGLDRAHPLWPERFDKSKLNELIEEDPDNPLWVVLKSMMPVTANQPRHLSFAEKIQTYEQVTQLIEDKKLGYSRKTNIGIHVTDAAIRLMRANTGKKLAEKEEDHNQATHAIQEHFDAMQSRVAKWEGKKHREKHGRLTISQQNRAVSTECARLQEKLKNPKKPFAELKDLEVKDTDNYGVVPQVVRGPSPRPQTPSPPPGKPKRSRKLEIELATGDEIHQKVVQPILHALDKHLLKNTDKQAILDALWNARQIVAAHPEHAYLVREVLQESMLGGGLRQTISIFQDEFYKKQLEVDLQAISHLTQETANDYLASSRQPWLEAHQKLNPKDSTQFASNVSELLLKEMRFVSEVAQVRVLLPILSKHLKKADQDILENYMKLADQLVKTYQALHLDVLFEHVDPLLSQEEMAQKLAKAYSSPEFQTYMRCMEELSKQHPNMTRILEKVKPLNAQILGSLLIKAPQRPGFIMTGLKEVKKCYAKPPRDNNAADAMFGKTMTALSQMGFGFNGQQEAQAILDKEHKGLTDTEHLLRETIMLNLGQWSRFEGDEREYRIDGYLRGILPVAYPKTFQRDEFGNIEVIGQNAAEIYKALTGETLDGAGQKYTIKVPLGSGNLDPDALKSLSQAEPDNPLWATLLIMQKMSGTPLSLKTKLQAYGESITFINIGRLGKKEKTEMAIALAKGAMSDIEKEIRRCALAQPPEELADVGEISAEAASLLKQIDDLPVQSQEKEAAKLYCEEIIRQIPKPASVRLEEEQNVARRRQGSIEQQNIERAREAARAQRDSRRITPPPLLTQRHLAEVFMPYLNNERAGRRVFFDRLPERHLALAQTALGVANEHDMWNPANFNIEALNQLITESEGDLKLHWHILKAIHTVHDQHTAVEEKVQAYQDLFQSVPDEHFELVHQLSKDVLEHAVIEGRVNSPFVIKYLKHIQEMKITTPGLLWSPAEPRYSKQNIDTLYLQMIQNIKEIENLTEDMKCRIIIDLVQANQFEAEYAKEVITFYPSLIHSAASSKQYETATMLIDQAIANIDLSEPEYNNYHRKLTEFILQPSSDNVHGIIPQDIPLENKIELYQHIVDKILTDEHLDTTDKSTLALELLKRVEKTVTQQSRNPRILKMVEKIEAQVEAHTTAGSEQSAVREFQRLKAQYQADIAKDIPAPPPPRQTDTPSL